MNTLHADSAIIKKAIERYIHKQTQNNFENSIQHI